MSILAMEQFTSGIVSKSSRLPSAYQSGLLGSGAGLNTLAANRVTMENLLAEILSATRAFAQAQVVSSGSIHGYAPQLSMPFVDEGRPATRRRERERLWRQTHRAELQQFVGQWIVLEGEQVVARGADPVEVVREARAKGIRGPFVHRVQRGRTKGEGYLGL
jgi:hypothetical protein